MENIQLACKTLPKRTQPRNVAFTGESDTQYLLVCEEKVLCKMLSLKDALFTTFAAYYCFNLEYPPIIKNIFYFFQDFLLEYPDSSKKSGALFIATVSDIKCNI